LHLRVGSSASGLYRYSVGSEDRAHERWNARPERSNSTRGRACIGDGAREIATACSLDPAWCPRTADIQPASRGHRRTEIRSDEGAKRRLACASSIHPCQSPGSDADADAPCLAAPHQQRGSAWQTANPRSSTLRSDAPTGSPLGMMAIAKLMVMAAPPG
jgi:hypothetical protein